jgi:hypothetical protein
MKIHISIEYFIYFTVIYTISIGISYIPSVYGRPGIISSVLLIFSLLLLQSRNILIIFNKFNSFSYIITYVFLIYILFHISYTTTFDINDQINIFPYISKPISIGLFIILLINLNEKKIYYSIKCYVYLAIIFSFCGLISWILISFDITAIGDNPYNLFIATDGKFGRDSDILNSYEYPYGLGLVLTGGHNFYFGDFYFYRASGWAHEPTTATLFVVPAMIILTLGRNIYFAKINKYFYFIIIFLFWSVCLSFGSIISIILLSFISALFNFYRNKFSIYNLYFLFFMLGLTILYLKTNFEFSNLLENKISGFNVAFEQLLLSRYHNMWDLFYGFTMIFIALITIIISLKSLLINKYSRLFGYIVLYIIIHSGKGSWELTLNYQFFIFFLFIMLHYSFNYNAISQTYYSKLLK